MGPRARLRLILRRALPLIIGAIAALLLASMLAVLMLRWVDPPTAAFLLRHWVIATLADEPTPRVRYRWVDWERIPPGVALAAVAAEEQRFPEHSGFDLVGIRRALRRAEQGGRLRGAITITQQTAKNLFLWLGRDWPRKGLEAWLTLLMGQRPDTALSTRAYRSPPD